MSDHVDRMREEGDQLVDRIQKLQAFFGTAIYANLPPHDRDLMQAQLSAMTTYLNILLMRLSSSAI